MRQFSLVFVCAMAIGACAATGASGSAIGMTFGRFSSIHDSEAVIDRLAFLTGEEATRAFQQDTGRTDEPANGFWIRDLHTTGTVVFSPAVAVTTLDCGSDGAPSPQSATLSRLIQELNQPETRSPCWSDYFWFQLQDGAINRITAQYVP